MTKDHKEILSRLKSYHASGSTQDAAARKNVLRKLRENISLMENDICEALYRDLGKTPEESFLTETGMVMESLKYFISSLGKLSRPKRAGIAVSQIPGRARIVPQPYGTVLIISPWNYPFLLALDPLVAAIAAGNCVVLKPSEYAPVTAAVVEKLISESVPSEWVSVIQGDAGVSESLLDEKFDYIFYTGGKRVGRIILQKAAVNLVPVTLELGGKSPVIVCRDADVKTAARRIVFGKYLNSGQTCVAPDYLLVQEEIHDELMTAMISEIDRMYPDGNCGKIITRGHYDRLVRLMENQNIIHGGKCDSFSMTISPTILDSPDPGSAIMQEEIFGPLLPVLTFKEESQAVGYIKGGEKPLAAYIFCGSKKRGMKIANSFSFGGGCVNDTVLHLASTRLPFGGVGESGMGCYHGKYGFDTFTHYKSMLVRGTFLDPPLRYRPFGKWKKRILKAVLG